MQETFPYTRGTGTADATVVDGYVSLGFSIKKGIVDPEKGVEGPLLVSSLVVCVRFCGAFRGCCLMNAEIFFDQITHSHKKVSNIRGVALFFWGQQYNLYFWGRGASRAC